MKKRQLAKLGLTLGLVAAVGVGGTMALLTAETDEVTNTFTVGDGLTAADLELDETNVDKTKVGEVIPARDKTNTYVDLTPSMSFVKDPQVRISAKAADCYAFIKVSGVDEFLNAMGGNDINHALITGWNEGWKLAKSEEKEGKDGIYYWQPDKGKTEGEKVSVGTNEFAQYVFTGIDLGKDAQLYKADGSKKEDGDISEIKIDACAVQAAGTDAAIAWQNAVDELPQDFKFKLNQQ